MTKTEIIKFLILRSIGNFLVLFAIFGVFATFGPALAYEAQFRIAQARGIRYRVASASKTTPLTQTTPIALRQAQGKSLRQAQGDGLAAVLTGPKEQILIAKDPQFSLVIAKIGASAKVFPNVDAQNKEEFLPVLHDGVAHAKGTVFPGMKGNSFLFAHSVDTFWNVGRYNAIFYLLKDLAVGDEVVVFFENIRYNYKVSQTKIVEPEDVSYLVKSQEGKDEQLILQTCWPPGTTWKRLIVLAKPGRASP